MLTWVSFALQVWNLYWPLPIGQMRRNKERVRLTEWNVGFYKHTTLERVRHDIRTYLLESAFQHDCGRERFLAALQVRLVETNPY